MAKSVKELSPELFSQYPIWHWDESGDALVPVDYLISSLNELDDNVLFIGARFRTVDDKSFEGYLIGTDIYYAFGLFINSQEYVFNMNLPEYFDQNVQEILDDATAKASDFFPLFYHSKVLDSNQNKISGVFKISIDSIEKVQAFIDTHIDRYTEVQIYRVLYVEGNLTEAEYYKLDCEKQCMFFILEDGGVRHRAYDDEAGLNEYPSFKTWTEDYVDYLQQRASSVRHDKLIARYYQILYNAPGGKHQNDAKSAIDAYIRVIDSGKYDPWPEWSNEQWRYLNILRNMLSLSTQVKDYKKSEIKSLIQKLATEVLKGDHGFLKGVGSLMIEHPKYFDRTALVSMEGIIEKVVIERWTDKDYFITPGTIDIGMQLAEKAGTDIKKWHRKLGQNYEMFADKRADDKTGMIPMEMTKRAMEAYQKAGDRQKVEELGVRYTRLSKNLKLTPVRIKLIDSKDSQMFDMLHQQVEILLAAEAEAIYQYLKHQLFLPDEEFLDHVSLKSGNVVMNDPFSLFNRIDFGRNKNIRNQPETDEEKRQDQLRNSYRLHHGIMLRPFIDALFTKGIAQKILTPQNLIDELAKSWIGEELFDTASDGTEHIFSWVELLAPSIRILFHEINVLVESPEYEPQLVPAIDSMVLKCEGMLRDLAIAVGDNTKRPDKRKGIQEKTLEDLLRLPKLSKAIDPADLLFFRFIYTRFGLNLRNDIGHAFFRARDYQPYYAYLLIVALLRFGKYNLVSAGDAEESTPEEE